MSSDVVKRWRSAVPRWKRTIRASSRPTPPDIHFLHIGKTAGSALKTTLEEHPPGQYRVNFRGHLVPLWDVPVGEPVFFVIRDPVERFVSGFWSRYRKGRPRHNIAWTPGEVRAFEQFRTPQALADALNRQDADVFASAVDAMGSISHVRSHLADWLGSPDYLRRREEDVVWIGEQRTLAEDLPALAEVLGLSNIEMPSDDVVAHRTPDELSRELTPEAAHAIRLWYGSDVALIEECERIRTLRRDVG